jgi:hypothetical protein
LPSCPQHNSKQTRVLGQTWTCKSLCTLHSQHHTNLSSLRCTSQPCAFRSCKRGPIPPCQPDSAAPAWRKPVAAMRVSHKVRRNIYIYMHLLCNFWTLKLAIGARSIRSPRSEAYGSIVQGSSMRAAACTCNLPSIGVRHAFTSCMP